MNRIVSFLKSRTVQVCVGLILINILEVSVDTVPDVWVPVINTLGPVVAAYFRINPKASF